MGRYSGYGGKTELDGLLWLDAAKLRAFGYFKQGKVISGTLSWTAQPSGKKSTIGFTVNLIDTPYAQAQYTLTDGYTGEKREFDYQIYLTQTTCNFGGRRWWLLCPLSRNGQPCRRRVRRLYQAQGYFGCRQCLNLCYPSQNENSRFRSYPFRLISNDTKADELWTEIKHPYYNGKPTRKMRQYLKLRSNDQENMAAWTAFEEHLTKII